MYRTPAPLPIEPHLFWQSRVAILSVLAVAGCLVFFGLSNNAFWDDEANTALFGRNLLHAGKLTAFDGTNVIGFRQGAELDAHLVNVYMPPVQYYLAALGLKFFGATTFGGRFPFVVAGLASIAILALFARWHFGNLIPLWLPPLFNRGQPGLPHVYSSVQVLLNCCAIDHDNSCHMESQ